MMETQDNDTRTLATCSITWFEDRSSGRGYYVADFDDGGRHAMPEENVAAGPLVATSDSNAIAQAVADELSLELISVEHDGEHAHATMRQR